MRGTQALDELALRFPSSTERPRAENLLRRSLPMIRPMMLELGYNPDD